MVGQERIDFLRKYVDSHGFWTTSCSEQQVTAELLCESKELRVCSSLTGWDKVGFKSPPKGADNFYVPFAIKSIYGMPHSLWRHLIEGVGC